MVPKSRASLPVSHIPLSNTAFADAVGSVLRKELGDTRRAAKTLMAWTGVSDHTARSWLAGQSSPDGLHLVVLAARCRPVLAMVLYMAGSETMALAFELEATEIALEAVLATVRQLRMGSGAPPVPG